ncbi:MAG: phosphocholine cytidylyltransferase family protein [candidate division KSB1 bacterium]|nr:phosphocholine cytidylyltransferase family protein [candidate division KSB1 bacterium]MDQ7066226.1 phosphocholine cytidylyltransferase family protein [candidate division KSB1 bacterium]
MTDSAFWDKAILLVAGKGERLKPRTDHLPKPMTEIGGVTILQNALANLAAFGVQQVYLVTGYMHEALMAHAREYASGMQIHEIYSSEYDRTNNMYSLWLARDILAGGCLLLEGDVFFAADVLTALIDVPADRSYWLADDFARFRDGCMLQTDANGVIERLRIVRGDPPDDFSHCYKSAGILAIHPETGRAFSRWLDEDVRRGRVQVYYDLVLADHLAEARLSVLDIGGRKWLEIDDEADLRRAEALFAAAE